MATREELLDMLTQADKLGNVKDAEDITKMIAVGRFDVPSLNEDFDDYEDPGILEREGFSLAGSIAGGMAGFQKTPGPWQAKALMGAVGAATGGFTGDIVQQELQKAIDSPLAPKTFEEEMGRALKYGGESALYDLAGNGIFKAGGMLWKSVKPKPRGGAEEADKVIGEQVVSEAGYKANEMMYRSHGLKVGDRIPAKLTATQMVSNKMLGTIETLAASSWGGGALKKQRELNDLAISEYTTKYINNFNNTAGKVLNDEGLGLLFQNGIIAGKAMHKKIGTEYYNNLDTLYKPLMKKVLVEKEVPSAILDAGGKMLTKKTTQLIEKEILPVSTKGLKDFARAELNKTAGTKNAALGSWSKSELNKILKFDDAISFKEAQAYRTKLIGEAENAKKGTGLGEGGGGGMASALAAQTDNIMAGGALATKNPEFIKAWRKANEFWKQGSADFSNKFVVSLMKKDASDIGKTLFNSTPEKIRTARASLRSASKLDDTVKFDQTWLDMQQGYLQKILSDTINPETGELSIHQLSQWMKPHSDSVKKLESAFTSAQRGGLKSFADSVKVMQRLPAGEGSFMITVGQAGMVLGGLGALSVGTQAWNGGEIVDDLALYTITPYVLSKLLLRPKWARTISAVMRMKGRPRLGSVAASTIAKLMAAANEIELLGER